MLLTKWKKTIIFLLGFWHFSVFAAVATSNLSVNTVVSSNCILSSAALSFGNYNPIGENKSGSLNAVTTFQVSCTKGANVSIFLNNGL